MLRTSATLASRLSPPVNALTRASRNGVTALPAISCAWPPASADRSHARYAHAEARSARESDSPRRSRRPVLSTHFARMRRATSAGVSARASTPSPLSRLQNAGRRSVPNPMTGTPCVSRYSRVRRRSSTALAPAHTTATDVRASSCKSAEMSKLAAAPRCTPPMPPVAKTGMPASAATIIVAATVVAPVPPQATTMGRSRRLTLATFVPSRARRSIASCARPAFKPSFDDRDRRGNAAFAAHVRFATAILAATMALLRTSATLASRLSPPVRRVDAREQERRHAPCRAMPCALRFCQRLRRWRARCASRGSSKRAGIGIGDDEPAAQARATTSRCMMRATSAGVSARASTASPLSRLQNAGRRSVP